MLQQVCQWHSVICGSQKYNKYGTCYNKCGTCGSQKYNMYGTCNNKCGTCGSQKYNNCGTCGSQRERHRHSYPQDPTTRLICQPVMLIFTPKQQVSVQSLCRRQSTSRFNIASVGIKRASCENRSQKHVITWSPQHKSVQRDNQHQTNSWR